MIIQKASFKEDTLIYSWIKFIIDKIIPAVLKNVMLLRRNYHSMKLSLSWWGVLSTKKFYQSASTRRAQLSVAVTTVKSTDPLNSNVKTWVNTD